MKNISDDNAPRIRDVRLKISDHDLEELGDFCGQRGITIQKLFEALVGDLTGDYGYSDLNARDQATEWVKCHHDITDQENQSLLKYVIKNHGIDGVKNLINGWDTKKQYENNPDKYAKFMGLGDSGVIKWWDDTINNLTAGYNGAIDDKAVGELKSWLKEYQKISI